MPVETVVLTDGAMTGVAPADIRTFAAAGPVTVKLGRLRPEAMPQALPLCYYFDPGKMTVQPPAETNRRATAQGSLSRMYLNDRYGCCVIAGKAHTLGLWSGADSDSPGLVTATDQEILAQYTGICGPGDNGCVITNVLNVMKSKGIQAGGRLYKIDGYVSIDWSNKLEVQVALYLFGALTLGINLPSAWTQQAVWDVTPSAIVGGHDVSAVDYGPEGVYISSWGRLYRMTWEAMASRKWVEECYVLLGQLWYGNDKLAPCGIDAVTLKVDLAKLGGGILPPIEPPVPIPPTPIPPTPLPRPTVVIPAAGTWQYLGP